MKQKICVIVFVISAFAVLGIIGGIEHGQPLKNLWVCLPCVMAMFVSYKLGNKED